MAYDPGALVAVAALENVAVIFSLFFCHVIFMVKAVLVSPLLRVAFASV
jgi:hypothetical protein